ncbi:MAG TPA: bifunctional DNA-binding transcriptional regulator/O6-methylguanine-DNA methyltransferase Ada [Stellaceae bacterium]|nr:bifunctional DNA-binding transcriptional regulator/O6-methylguanine-DNA methyltransferase Ada [Stellaceae bacterium]
MAMSKSVTEPIYATDAARWDAVRNRDRRADGVFYYSVATTGVYCRPACAARLALRQNVAFHDSCAAAERAGFRPCKRCRPNEVADAGHAVAVAAACRAIEQDEEMPSLDALAAQAGLSRFHFHRLFKRATGVTPRQYAAAHRGRRLRDELPKSASVTAAMYDAGFNSSGRFYAASAQLLGMQPSAYAQGGRGASIRFAVGETSLGAILVAATDKGVCAITLGEEPERLVRTLQDRFPNAVLVGGDGAFEALVAKAVGLVEAPGLGTDLPLDVRGTAFQQRVWQALRAIPAGTTASYAEVARRVGKPKAVRAVAQACAANPVAVAIPCHRVVRTDGDLSGYRWGVERKRELLRREAR